MDNDTLTIEICNLINDTNKLIKAIGAYPNSDARRFARQRLLEAEDRLAAAYAALDPEHKPAA